MSASGSMNPSAELSDKQRDILEYLQERVDEQTYFKSRRIGNELGLTAKEVGANMAAIQRGTVPLTVEKWGYSSSTTWQVSR